MRLFNKVVIIGVGLIGGSIGLCIKRRKLARQIIGVSRHKKTIRSAIRRGAIDRGSLDISVVSEADLVILATPVNSIIHIGSKISSLVKPGALVTDTGSTKRLVVKKLEDILANFVGAHPLAGSQKQGVINAKHDLFSGCFCVLTPTVKTSKAALSTIKAFWIKLGARVVYLSPARHDRFISYISHLPHIVAFSLIQSVPRESLYLASSGLKYTTRIAASPTTVWKDILLTNPENVLHALKKFTRSLSQIKSAIKQKDVMALERILRQARLKRESLEA